MIVLWVIIQATKVLIRVFQVICKQHIFLDVVLNSENESSFTSDSGKLFVVILILPVSEVLMYNGKSHN